MATVAFNSHNTKTGRLFDTWGTHGPGPGGVICYNAPGSGDNDFTVIGGGNIQIHKN